MFCLDRPRYALPLVLGAMRRAAITPNPHAPAQPLGEPVVILGRHSVRLSDSGVAGIGLAGDAWANQDMRNG